MSSPFLSNNDIYTTSSSPRPPLTSPSTSAQNSARGSTRLRQLLANKSPSANDSVSQSLQYHNDGKLDDLIQGPESPTTTHVSPSNTELLSSSSSKRRRKNSSNSNEQNNPADVLLKQILGRQSSFPTSPMKTESNHSDDSTSSGQATNKQRSDIFLRVNFLFTIEYSSKYSKIFILDIIE